MDKDESINIIPVKSDGKGCFFCGDIPISKEQWVEILRDKEITTSSRMKVLLSVYFMPRHKASCSQLVDKYGNNQNTYNASISSYGKSIVRRIGTFSILENGKERFWHVTMEKGCDVMVGGSRQFEWQMRKELVAAIETILIEKAIERYVLDFDKYWEDEKYKWLAVQWFQKQWNPKAVNIAEMIEQATSKTSNLLASMNSFPRAMLINFAKVAPDDVKSMFDNLFDESVDLVQRVQDFIQKSEAIRKVHNPGSWKMHYQTINAISTYLWLRYPEKYYIYKYREYLEVNRKLGLGYTFKRNGQVEEMIKGFELYDKLKDYLVKNHNLIEKIGSHVKNDPNLFDDTRLCTTTIDFGFWLSRHFKSIEESLFDSKIKMTPFVANAIRLLETKRNIILQGAPGTGKTYNTAVLAVALIDGSVPVDYQKIISRYEQLREENRIGFTTFHQSMDYEDFIEGIKPINEDGVISYEVKDGIFKRMCTTALSKKGEPFVLIIDEINRGNVSKIFGEVITLLEKDKRLCAEHPITLSLPYSKQVDFGVPENLYIIGTMNTTNRSAGTIDYAIRRRFAFITIPANREVIANEYGKALFDSVEKFIEDNKYADIDVDDLMVGHSYFMADNEADLVLKVKYEIIPLIKEYIKDGILSIRPDEAQKEFDRWLKLENLNDYDNGTSEG